MEDKNSSLVTDLVILGLKEYEARVLVALVKSGRAMPTSKLTSISQVPRNKIYQVLDSLINLGVIKVDEITGSANMYGLLYEPENLVTLLKQQLTDPIENATIRVLDQFEQISSTFVYEENDELIHQIQIIRGKQNIFRLLRKNIEMATDQIFSNILPLFILPIEEELKKARQRGVNVSLVLTDEEFQTLSKDILLNEISNSITGISLNKLENILNLPIFETMGVNLDKLIDPFGKFLRNRPNIVMIDSEKETGILFLLLKSEDPSSEILGVQTYNREIVKSFSYLAKLISSLASSLQTIQKEFAEEN
jgi:sugar-specific transcriptional regulator TrmB